MTASTVQPAAFSNNSLASGASYVSTNQVLMTTAAGSIPNTAATYYAAGEIQLSEGNTVQLTKLEAWALVQADLMEIGIYIMIFGVD